MNITLLHRNELVTTADLHLCVERYFRTDRILKSFDGGYEQKIWKEHVGKYSSKVVKIALIRRLEDHIENPVFPKKFEREFTNIIMFLDEKVLLYLDIIIVDIDRTTMDMIPFIDMLDSNSKYSNLLDLSHMSPKEKHGYREKMAYLVHHRI